MKDYWESRHVAASSSIGTRLKRSSPTLALMGALYSLRARDEAFIAKALKGCNSVLDIACGGGKSVIPATVHYVAGVDISGYPKCLALNRGYNECVDYAPPDYRFSISREVDAITAINLNAHVPFVSYELILRRSLSFLRPGGSLILVNEYDNDGLSYRLMKGNRQKFDRMVRGMEHWHLESEQGFLTKLEIAFPQLSLSTRTPLIGSLLPSLHYHAYATERPPSRLEGLAMLATDLPLSLINYVQSQISRRFNKCFLVGYVFHKP